MINVSQPFNQILNGHGCCGLLISKTRLNVIIGSLEMLTYTSQIT